MTSWRRSALIVVMATLSGMACATLGARHPGDAAFAAGDLPQAVSCYRRELETAGRLPPRQQLRFVLALAADATPEDQSLARQLAAELAESGHDDGSAAALVTLLDDARRTREACDALAAERARLHDLARVREVVEKTFARASWSLRHLAEALDGRLTALQDELAASRRRLTAATLRITELEEQIDQLKRIDLAQQRD